MKISLTTMPVGTILFQVIAIASLVPSSSINAGLRGAVRGAVHQNLTETLQNIECALFLRSTERKFLTEEKWSCEFDFSETSANLGINETVYTTFELEGIDHNFMINQGAKSGRSLFFASEAILEGSHGRRLLEIPPTAIVKVLERPKDLGNIARRRRLADSSGTLKTLVVRVIAMNGIEPTASIDQLRSDVFEDQLCLKSQYEACSHGRLKIEPFYGTAKTGRTINGGVVEVKINANPSDGNRDVLEAKAKEKTTELYGDLGSQFDLVMFSIPPGSGDWLAYAYINRYDSFFNDHWSSSVSTQVHEVGHSLGLAHSGEGSNPYGDQSGSMGYSYNADDAPNMCFNPAKNYQLGWYTEQQKYLNPLTDILAKTSNDTNSRVYILNGVNDFQFGASGSQDKLIILRLKQQNTREDYYIGFNRKAGMNSGTIEDADDVTIIKKTGGPIEHGQSWKVAKLSAIGDTYTIKKFDGSSFDVTIELLSIVGKDAQVKIGITNSIPCNKVKDSNNLSYKDKKKKDCDWVSRKKYKRCSKIWENRLLSEWCPRICGSCPSVP